MAMENSRLSLYSYPFDPSAVSPPGTTRLEEDQYRTLMVLLASHEKALALYTKLHHAPMTKTSVLLTSFLPTKDTSLPMTFSVLHVDRSRAPSVQAGTFSSIDLQSPLVNSEAGSYGPADHSEQAALDMLLSMLRVVRLSSYVNALSLRGDPIGVEDALMIGSVPARTRQLIQRCGLLRDDIRGPGGPYGKFIFPVPPSTAEDALPEGLTWDQVREPDYDLVIATNGIVTGPEMLRGQTNVAIREGKEGVLAAWVYLGDGNVRTLHCQEKWRRKGLARRLVVRITRQASEDGSFTLFSVDADHRNIASVELFTSLGAHWSSDNYWIRVDLTRLPEDHVPGAS